MEQELDQERRDAVTVGIGNADCLRRRQRKKRQVNYADTDQGGGTEQVN